MELFGASRLLEDEVPQQSAEILEKLKIQAEERKQERELKRKRESDKKEISLTELNQRDVAPEPSLEKEKHKKKKKRKLSEALADPTEDSIKTAGNEAPKKKKKTRKREGLVVSETNGLTEWKENDAESKDRLMKLDEKGATNKTVKKKKRTKTKKKSLIECDEAEVKEWDESGFTFIGEVKDQKSQKVNIVVPYWMADASIISIDLHKKLTGVSELPGLHPSLVALLKENGIHNFFPVQSKTIPWLLESIQETSYRPSDLCVSAPTGSGKTLAFALPIIQALRQRVVCSIRALIVLPVVNLAMQVHNVFITYCKGSGLQVGLAVGQARFEAEQAALVRNGYRGYHSTVDILICTPGRLVDHITKTPGFTLKNLRFIVIDEADRIMQQIKQGWLSRVEQSFVGGPETIGSIPLIPSRLGDLRRVPQKLLFSATLTHDPEKIKKLKLFQPKLFTPGQADVDTVADQPLGRYLTPKELTELYVSCELALKPLVLLHFIHHLKYRYILCFTNTLESSHRLYLLLSSFGGVKAQEFSSQLGVRHREKILQQFAQGLIDVLVCSDALARGMDIENVRYVISYDMPHFLKGYIHRVGRTARAGRNGTAISLLQPHEVTKFKSMMELAGKTNVRPLEVNQSKLEPMESKYKVVLEQVAHKVAAEAQKGSSKHK